VEATGRWRRDVGGRRLLDLPAREPRGMPGNSMAEAESWAAGIEGPAYAIDDETAIKVTDGTVEVVSEGHWQLFNPSPKATEAG
jgi:hypothetical protein